MRKFLFIIVLLFIGTLFMGCEEQPVEPTEIKVTFQDTTGTIIDEIVLTADTIIDLTSYDGENYYYQWDKTKEEILSSKVDIVVTGTYIEKTLDEFTSKHIFIIDGNVVYQEEGELDLEPTKPAVPEGTDTYSWDKTEKLEENVYVYTYTLTYELKKFTVKFVDVEGNLLKEEVVSYGNNATAPETEKEVTWDKKFDVITSDLVVTGTFKQEFYNIELYDGETLLDLGISTYEVGKVTKLPKPEKAGYEFAGWFASSISLYRFVEIDEDTTGDIKLYARFIDVELDERFVLPSSTYKLVGINKMAHSSGNGTYVYQPILPDDAPNKSNSAYKWTSSDESVATISIYSSITGKKSGYSIITGSLDTGDGVITVNGVIKVTSEGIQFSSEEEANTIELCTVTFVGKDDEVIDVQTVIKGGAVYYPTPLEYEGLAFDGWDKVNYNILEDTTIKAKYKEGTNKYVGKKFGLIGDSISTYQDYIPAGYSCFYPYPTADVNDVNQTWWMQVVNKLGAGMFINNSYSGSCVSSGTGDSATVNDKRLSTLVINGQTPDVIIIYMGSNDCGSKYVTDTQFKSSYRVMLDKVKKLCPNAEIILCTLPESNLYKEADRLVYNEIIEDYAKEYGLKLINLKNVDITGHLVDSAHPKKSGMTVVANRVLKDIVKE